MHRIAFLFSGQGAQYPGMMSEFYSRYAESRDVFSLADQVLGREISELCFHGAQEDLNLTYNTQPCTLAADLAAYAAITHHGIKPNATAGFSLGEYAALVCAGVLGMADAFKIIQIRADAMQKAVPAGQGLMAAIIGSDDKIIEGMCKRAKKGYVIAANYNCPGQIVISGQTDAVREVIGEAGALGIRSVELPVSAPFHCELMAPAAEQLKDILMNITFGPPEVPVYLNVDASVLQPEQSVPTILERQAKSPVHWQTIIENMHNDGIDTFIELGPGKTLSQFVKRTLKGVTILRVEDMKTLQDTIDCLND